MNMLIISKLINLIQKEKISILKKIIQDNFSYIFFVFLVVGLMTLARIPMSILVLFLSCFICVRLTFLCKNKIIGGGYFVLVILLCNIPARLILKSLPKPTAISFFSDFIHQNIFFFGFIFASFILVLIIEKIKELFLSKVFLFFLNILSTIILIAPIALTLCYLLNWSFGNPVLSTDAILAFYQTNASESYSYFVDFIHKKRMFTIIVGLILFVYISYKMSSNIIIGNLSNNLKNLSNWCVLGLCLIICAVSFYKYNSNMVTMPFKKAEATLEEYKVFNELASERKNVIKKLTKKNDNSFKGTYVLVIGESESRAQMGAYGYRRNTTPWLSKIKNNPNSIFFENVFSCHTHTVPVLSYALTQKNQYNNSDLDWQRAVSIIDIAKYTGGFNTTWISNQGKIGVHETPISSIADTADQQYFTNIDWTDPFITVYDEELISHIETLKQDSERNLIVIHLMGCHGSYTSRYPSNFDLFTEDSLQLNAYNNAIYYNDYVLHRIYETVKKIPNFQAMLYFSDHGDDVYRELGHNSAKFTWDMAKIPFWMIFSDEYQKNHPDIITNLRSHEKVAFTNDMVFESMLGLLGITDSEYYSGANDISSNEYAHSVADLKTLHGKKSLSDLPSEEDLKKVWLHRVDCPEKLLELGDSYYGLEFDVVFHEDLNDYDNSHDRMPNIEYPLRNQFKTLTKLKNGTKKYLWIDFKNLTHENKYMAEKKLDELINEFNIKKENCYVESNNWKDLDAFKDKGWNTSYYFPYYDLEKLSRAEIQKIKKLTEEISYSGKVSAVSFAQGYYDLVNSMNLNKDINLLTWFDEVERRDFEGLDKYFHVIKNPRIKGVLVREFGNYHR